MMFVLLLLSALLPCLVLGAKTTWRDPFVQAAPLVVAARCRDGGVCLVAAHSPEEEDPLLYYDGEGDEKMDDAGSRFLDLPRRYGGPFRIQAIGFGCVMAPIGWRADCHELVDASIELSSEEIKKFGPGDMHGVYLSDALSIYLAQCQSSESQRTLSAITLLVTPVRNGADSRLCLVDATGVTELSFLAIGGGTTDEGKRLSDVVNDRLAGSDLSSLSRQECFQEILKAMAGNEEGQRGRTRLELAFMEPKTMALVRDKVSSYLGGREEERRAV